ncbi:g7770 [Coccomyxa elongata]
MAGVRNLDYYLNRLNGYSKNTIRVQPVSKQTFNSGETIIIRLPTNAIIDLHTLVLSMDGGAFTNLQTTNAGVASTSTPNADFPRYVQSLFRRVDVTAGGVQVGLGSLSDYGAVWSLLALNTLGQDKHNELSKYELAGELSANNNLGPFYQGGQDYPALGRTATGVTAQAQGVVPTGTSNTIPTQRLQCSNWLGVLGGNFMRFLDTNLLPDVEIRLTLNSPYVLVNNLPANQTGPPVITYANSVGNYAVTNLYMAMETISFGDDSYRRMLDSRLATGDPIIVPFTNWASFETSAPPGSTNSVTQFTVATQSLNALYGTARVGNYDSTMQSATTSTVNPIGIQTANKAYARQVPYYQFKSLDVCQGTAAAGAAGRIEQNTRYQFTIDSKTYPQFLADSNDCYYLTRNAFDGGAVNRYFESALVTGNNQSLASQAVNQPLANVDWQENAFMLGLSLEHNGDSAHSERMISGLNTNGSNILVTWNIYNVTTPNRTNGFRPIVFLEMTSTLMVYAGRVISVIK